MWPDVPQPEDARAVGDNGDGVRLVRILKDFSFILFNLTTGGGDPRGVPDPKVLYTCDGTLQGGLDLPPIEGVPSGSLLCRNRCFLLPLFYVRILICHRHAPLAICSWIRSKFFLIDSSRSRYKLFPWLSMVIVSGPKSSISRIHTASGIPISSNQ